LRKHFISNKLLYGLNKEKIIHVSHKKNKINAIGQIKIKNTANMSTPALLPYKPSPPNKPTTRINKTTPIK